MKMVKSRDGVWFGLKNKVHCSNSTMKMNQMKRQQQQQQHQRLVRKTRPESKHPQIHSYTTKNIKKNIRYGHFVMNGFGRLENTDIPPPKLKLFAKTTPHRSLNVPPQPSTSTTYYSDDLLSAPLAPSPRPEFYEYLRLNLMSPDSLKLSRSLLIASPMIVPNGGTRSSVLLPTTARAAAVGTPRSMGMRLTPSSSSSLLRASPLGKDGMEGVGQGGITGSPPSITVETTVDLLELLFSSTPAGNRSLLPLSDSPFGRKTDVE